MDKDSFLKWQKSTLFNILYMYNAYKEDYVVVFVVFILDWKSIQLSTKSVNHALPSSSNMKINFFLYQPNIK